jgi:hypothetical protein
VFDLNGSFSAPGRKFYTALTILLSFSRVAVGQSTFASITGTVTDSSGAAVPAAKIVVKNNATNIETTTTSNGAGIYTVAELNEGVYSLQAQASGFKEFVAGDVALAARDLRRIDVVLQVGSMDTKVEVTAGATLIETETARISDIKTVGRIDQLPLNSMSIWASLALSPNLLQAGNGSSTIRFAGSTANQANWSIDGTSFSDGVTATQIGPLANFVEWMQELKIDLANNTAEFGTLGQVTAISKSGTNEFHGAAFDYYTTPGFLSRNPFALTRPSGVSQYPGMAAGGPIYLPKIYNGKNRSFFFVQYETFRGVEAPQLLNPTVPLPAWRNGDFSGLLPGTLIYDPATNQPFPNNQIPANRINPVSQKYQNLFYPLPNFGGDSTLQSQNYRANLNWPYANYDWGTRIDHHFSDHDSIFGRIHSDDQKLGQYYNNDPTIPPYHQHRADWAGGVTYTHVFRPDLINELRWGFAFNNNPVIGDLNGPNIVQQLGVVGLAPNLPNIAGLPAVSWSGIGLTSVAEYPYTSPGSRENNHEFQDTVSWFHGRHNFKMGADVTRIEYDSYSANAALFGSLTFSNRFSSGGVAGQGNPYADFLLGIPTTVSRAFPPVPVNRNRFQNDFFFLDDFKVSSKLTLNVGLRYELHLPWHENSDYISLFDISNGKIVVPDSALSKVSSLLPASYVGVVGAKAAGLPESLIRADTNNFAPRIGLAYRPWSNKTVFRAGYGIYYDVVPQLPTNGGIPFVLNEPAYTNPYPNPTVILPQVFPNTGVGGPSTVSLPNAINPNLKIPYSMQYNFTIEHEQWHTGFRASYIGTAERQGVWSYNYNSPLPNTLPYIAKLSTIPYAQYPGINYYTNGSTHDYNALTLTATRSMAQGLYFQSSWTWARDLGTLLGGATAEDPFSLLREYGVQLDVPTHRFTNNMTYELPFGTGRHWLRGASLPVNLIAGGWDVSVIYSLYSGQFLTPLWTGSDPTGTAYTTSSTPALVTIRPNQLCNPNLPSGQRSVNAWFNAACFAPPTPGQFGSAANGVIQGPGVNVWHMGVYKNLVFQEHQRIKARLEVTATNVFNHPNWSNPATNVSQTSNVGVITGVGGVNGASTGDVPGARALRAAIRVEW